MCEAARISRKAKEARCLVSKSLDLRLFENPLRIEFMAKSKVNKKTRALKRPLWVIKIGSQIIIDEGPLFVRGLIRDITILKLKHRVDVIVVTSGAIASARIRLRKQWHSLPEKQALSALGQPMIMELYNAALHSYGQLGAQVLLTYADFKNTKSRNNFRNTLKQLLKWKVVPILNENDAIATEEIQFGDNDLLSALVAADMKASKLILLTNVDGVYDRAPSEKNACLIPVLHNVFSKQISTSLRPSKSKHGRGGMTSKLQSAQKASKSGVDTLIVNGSRPKVLLEIAQGRNPGTLIPSKKRGDS
ncbi:MAG: glutamate 5-kinase [Bdellovibrionaceae bacterium]|nr:glutamate 5-kinase [Pseudobdellovibrionaceae bacterium]